MASRIEIARSSLATSVINPNPFHLPTPRPRFPPIRDLAFMAPWNGGSSLDAEHPQTMVVTLTPFVS